MKWLRVFIAKQLQNFIKELKKPRTKEHQDNLTKALIGRRYKNKNPSKNKGKTYEEIYGYEKANELRKARSKHMAGRLVSNDTRIKQSKIRKGATCGGKNNNARPVTVNGVFYTCKKDAQIALNLTIYELNKLLKN